MPAIQVVTVVGSATPPGRLRRAVDEAGARATQARPAAAARLVDLADHPLAPADGRPLSEHDDDAPALIEALAAADAVVLATPVYRGSLTGTLKNLLDLTPVEALEGTPVALVSMGASDHHFLGADRHLRDVLAFFGAFVTPVSVYLTSADFADGAPCAAAAADLDSAFASAIDLAVALREHPSRGPRPLLARLAQPRG